MDVTKYDGIVVAGGQAPMFLYARAEELQRKFVEFYEAGKVACALCHGVALLRYTRLTTGEYLVTGKTVTGFTNGEEEDVGLTKVVPFLVEDELMSLGATFSKVKNWGVHTIADGQLITGQNPASSGPTASVLIETLNQKAK